MAAINKQLIDMFIPYLALQVQQQQPEAGKLAWETGSEGDSINGRSPNTLSLMTSFLLDINNQHRRLERTQSEPAKAPALNVNTSSLCFRYKTELCRPYEESGSCKYGEKCQFAHGGHELRCLARHPKYKTELCRTFHSVGFCPYGPRCHFIHNADEARGSKPRPRPLSLDNAASSPPSSLGHMHTASSSSPSSLGSLSPPPPAYAYSSTPPNSPPPPPAAPASPPESRLPVFNRISAPKPIISSMHFPSEVIV
ncbi:protein TIS11 isoform X3 [Cimex lectularius]|uniref:C3H1-type domain-containing protein n=1 Tax=Cimex lectularius TaxID=79782 RepID=A0A8I6SCD7_CIMLE|nr:protein TIS11 isoform X3 [Cimex lectularius]